MKKVLVTMLAMVMSLGMAVPAMAANHYSFQSYTHTDTEGNVIKFDAANTEYRIYHSGFDGKIYYQPLVVLKDHSGYSAKAAMGDWMSHYTYIIEMDTEMNYPFYHDGVESSIDPGKGNEIALFEQHFEKNWDEYGKENFFFASKSAQGIWTFFMTESAAKNWDAYIEPMAPVVEKPVVEEPVVEADYNDPDVYFTEGDQLADGVSYEFVLKNKGDTDIEAYYAMMTYDPETTGALQIHPMNVKLAPGETYRGNLSSAYWGMSNNKVFWLAFDDVAERDTFLADSALYSDDIGNTRYVLQEDVDAADWLNDLQNRAEK